MTLGGEENMSKQKLSLTGKLLPLGNNLCRGKRHLCFCLELGADSALKWVPWVPPPHPILGFTLLKAVLLSPSGDCPSILGCCHDFYKHAHPGESQPVLGSPRAAPTLWLAAILMTPRLNPNFLFVPIHHLHPALSTFTP